MRNIIQKYNKDAFEKCKSYKKPHYWNIDTPNKCIKYGLPAMLQPNAYSSITNIRENVKTKNVLMIYLHENTLIISEWKGQETLS